MTRRLLWCGILSSFLYLANDLSAVLLWPAYDHASQAVSELTARGAPTQPWLKASAIVYDLLLLAFAMGVVRRAPNSSLVRAGILIGLIAVVGAVTTLLVPMHLRGDPRGAGDSVHIATTGVTVLAIVAAMALGGAGLRGRFLWWSLTAMGATLIFGAIAGLQGARIDAGLPTPWLGVVERLSIGSYLLWVAALSVRLLQDRHHQGKLRTDVQARS